MPERLNHAREYSGVSFDALSGLVGISKRQLIRYTKPKDKGGVVPKVSVLERICKAIGANIEWVMHGKGPMMLATLEKETQRLPAETVRISLRIDDHEIHIIPEKDSFVIESGSGMQANMFADRTGAIRIKLTKQGGT